MITITEKKTENEQYEIKDRKTETDIIICPICECEHNINAVRCKCGY